MAFSCVCKTTPFGVILPVSLITLLQELLYNYFMNIAVVGHIEWGRFFRVDRIPGAGEIIHADEIWEEVAGGGSVAAMQLAQLNGNCKFFSAVGDDELGKKAVEQLQANGVEVYAQIIDNRPTKTIAVHIDKNNERTITVAGDLRPSGKDTSLPWEKLKEMDAVYFVSGDIQALEYSRRSKVLTSTARIKTLLNISDLQLDALLTSEKDSGERYKPDDINPVPKFVITTQGARGGYLDDGTRYEAEIIPSENIVDFYGCGDSFAAGVTYGLVDGNIHDALAVGIKAGAVAAQRRGAFGN